VTAGASNPTVEAGVVTSGFRAVVEEEPAVADRLSWSSPSKFFTANGSVSSSLSSSVCCLPPCLQRIMSIDGVGLRSKMDRSLLKVHLANGGFKVFKCSEKTTVKVRLKSSRESLSLSIGVVFIAGYICI